MAKCGFDSQPYLSLQHIQTYLFLFSENGLLVKTLLNLYVCFVWFSLPAPAFDLQVWIDWERGLDRFVTITIRVHAHEVP